MSINNRVIDWIETLEKWPKTIIGQNHIDYVCLQGYVEGFIHGLDCGLDIPPIIERNIMRQISYWFQEKVNQKANVFFTHQILMYYEGKSDDELKAILLSTLKEYFTVNPVV